MAGRERDCARQAVSLIALAGAQSWSRAHAGVRGLAVAMLVGGVTLAADAQIPLDPGFSRWALANARSLGSMDAPYADSAYDFLRPLIGNARLLALGENIHGGHEPLAFRNHAIRYAITHLGFTAVAIESGLTEGMLVDRYIQGEAGNLDSVVKTGISYGFGDMRENRELVAWLREHNEQAARKVHFYGIDQSGVGNADMGGTVAIEATLQYVERVAPGAGATYRAALSPLLTRFTSPGYLRYSSGERQTLRRELTAMQRRLHTDSAAFVTTSSALEYARASRNAWAALRLEQAYVVSGTDGPRAMPTIRLRDSVMAENTTWALGQAGPGGRVIVFAHNGHVMNVPLYFPAMGEPMVMMGQRLRATYGAQLVVIATASATFTGLGNVPDDMSTFEVALARVRRPSYVIDLRTADQVPAVSAMLRAHWITRIHAWFQPITPREATDVVVVLDKVTASQDR